MNRLAVTVLTVCAGAPALASAAVVSVSPGAMTSGTQVVGTMQNLPSIMGTTYSAGPNMFPTVSAYYGSPQLPADQAAVAGAARQWVNTWIKGHCTGTSVAAVKRCRPAVVFDIDDTLLNTFSYSAAQDPVLSFHPSTWDAYVQACGYAPIRPTINLLNDLMARGVHVAIVSGGSAANAPAFTACLRANGVKGWSTATFKPADAAGTTAGRWKASQRAAIRSHGWKIVASVGDQVSDMSYGSVMRGFLMPNTMAYLA